MFHFLFRKSYSLVDLAMLFLINHVTLKHLPQGWTSLGATIALWLIYRLAIRLIMTSRRKGIASGDQ